MRIQDLLWNPSEILPTSRSEVAAVRPKIWATDLEVRLPPPSPSRSAPEKKLPLGAHVVDLVGMI